ncbi:hypothetical protein SAMD00019534_111470 [Acytostelium subglobosum LB1]|uniref:hypothetical protein n=1 Tax=Acytostelium subglobosum LB1 TaxID=1410327 RepID=UPI000644F62A|nr:hypothetical protein SAMD00019534_111470 [Acytostelium subglobosum LB1]GAM27971.1 hypothetical protein SAMD00019534_111470 [Acytostelium subglobosum LB1]|eukprot:XP_012748930.1 hypothetical protein SAMD00019534_111470 [Acytostelium subglobosum LB1]
MQQQKQQQHLKLAVAIVTMLAFASSVALAAPTTRSWLNEDVVRTIDLTTQLAKQSVTIKAKNIGDAPSSTYTFALLSSVHASIQAFIEGEESSPLSVSLNSQRTHQKLQFDMYNVQLDKPIKAGSTVNLKLRIVSMGQMTPYPTHIAQAESQLVMYKDNHYFSSPYDTQTQKTTLKLASAKVEDHSSLSPSILKGSSLVYGPYKDVRPLAFSALHVHFENNASFLMLANLVKEYEVSHWGNVAVETTYNFEHRGAALKGPFSRLDYQRNQAASPSHVAEIVEQVPKTAADFYYRDYIGNISTSQYTHAASHLNFKITPRFPLFGGWKIEFYTGFNVPSSSLLFTDSDTGRYVLNATFGVAIADVWAERHEMRVVLPEGSTDIQIVAPFKFELSHDVRKTFFDTVGRPVIVLIADHTSFEHTQTLQISYSVTPLSWLHEPLLAMGAVMVLCLSFMVLSRLDLSLIRKGPKIERSPQVEKLAQQFFAAFESRLQYHIDWEEALANLARHSTIQKYLTSKAEIDARYKDTAAVNKVLESISTEDQVFSARLKELNSQENQLSQIQNQLFEAEKRRNTTKDLSKKEYEEIKSKYLDNYRKAYDSVRASFDQILA